MTRRQRGQGRREVQSLRRLARSHGVQLSYTANDGARMRASDDTLQAILLALGVAVTTGRDADDQLADHLDRRRSRCLEPVVVTAPGGAVSSALLLPRTSESARCRVTVECEDWTTVSLPLPEAIAGSSPDPDDRATVALALNLDRLRLPVGYHQLRIEGPAIDAKALLMVPPRAAPVGDRSYGVFAPLYGLRGDTDWGVGSFSELSRLADYAGSHGAAVVGTLPMYPAFLTGDVDPSPYLPVSRLFLNELFIDVEAVAELAASPDAAAMVASPDFQRDRHALSAMPRVQYAEVMAHKRRVLEACAGSLVDGLPGLRREAFAAFVATHPELVRYADFRASCEQHGQDWRTWSTVAGDLPESGIDKSVSHYHQYVQFVAAEQFAAAASGPDDRAGLYLDLPVGVHPHGYDTWAFADVFASATVGAPPDRLAPQGQAWGFPPLHPQRVREASYRYVIDTYRHLLRHAKAIRIDHALGLQRLFWIPPGFGAEAGAYVTYRSEELRAIVGIEAARAGAIVIGEDLGTVSDEIRRAMDQDGMLHTFVYQFDASPSTPHPQPTSPSLASLGSHDLPRFAAFWRGVDIDDRAARGLLDPAAADDEHTARGELATAVAQEIGDGSVGAAFASCIGSLAAGPARCVMVDVADLEGEIEPDNRPGTGPEADNWRLRLARPLTEIIGDPEVATTLTAIHMARQHSLAEEVVSV